MRTRIFLIAVVLSLVGLYLHARYHFAHNDVAGLYVLDGREDVVTTLELKPDGTFEKDDGFDIRKGHWKLKDLKYPLYDRGVVLLSGDAPANSFPLERRGDKVCWRANEDDAWCRLGR